MSVERKKTDNSDNNTVSHQADEQGLCAPEHDGGIKESFCAGVKEQLRANKPRRRCCRRAYTAALALCGGGYEYGDSDTAEEAIPIFECENCRSSFFAGIFCEQGTVSNPETGYHLEIESGEYTEQLADILTAVGIEPKIANRRGRSSIYYKDSSQIEDFLNFIGASTAAFAVINAKIRRDLRNNANRMTNCDAANIGKTVAASARQIASIQALKSSGALDNLPDELRETADLRLQYPDATLGELAALHSSGVTKSGVSHRLSRLCSLAKSGAGG